MFCVRHPTTYMLPQNHESHDTPPQYRNTTHPQGNIIPTNSCRQPSHYSLQVRYSHHGKCNGHGREIPFIIFHAARIRLSADCCQYRV